MGSETSNSMSRPKVRRTPLSRVQVSLGPVFGGPQRAHGAQLEVTGYAWDAMLKCTSLGAKLKEVSEERHHLLHWWANGVLSCSAMLTRTRSQTGRAARRITEERGPGHVRHRCRVAAAFPASTHVIDLVKRGAADVSGDAPLLG